MSNIDRIPIKDAPRLMEAVSRGMLMWRIRPRVSEGVRRRLLKG